MYKNSLGICTASCNLTHLVRFSLATGTKNLHNVITKCRASIFLFDKLKQNKFEETQQIPLMPWIIRVILLLVKLTFSCWASMGAETYSNSVSSALVALHSAAFMMSVYPSESVEHRSVSRSLPRLSKSWRNNTQMTSHGRTRFACSLLAYYTAYECILVHK